MTGSGSHPPSVTALLADIGGTNARFALANRDEIWGFRSLPSADHPSLEHAAEAYLALEAPPGRPSIGAFALAGPVTGDLIRMTNLPWEFSTAALSARLRLERLEIVNDSAAIAYSIPHLQEDQRRKIGDGQPVDGGVIGVLGPGSGLGVSALVQDAGGWRVLSTEGGHVTLPVVTHREMAVLGQLGRKFGHVSAERALSGPGMVNLYEALCAIDSIAPLALTPAELCDLAVGRHDARCGEALDMFCSLLGTVAGNLALTYGATGGIYLAGGILPRILPFLEASSFRNRFLEKGRMRAYLEPIPSYLVTHKSPALAGLRAHLFADAVL